MPYQYSLQFWQAQICGIAQLSQQRLCGGAGSEVLQGFV